MTDAEFDAVKVGDTIYYVACEAYVRKPRVDEAVVLSRTKSQLKIRGTFFSQVGRNVATDNSYLTFLWFISKMEAQVAVVVRMQARVAARKLELEVAERTLGEIQAALGKE